MGSSGAPFVRVLLRVLRQPEAILPPVNTGEAIMSRTSTPPNTERKKTGNSVAKWVKFLLCNRWVLLLVMQALFRVVKLMRALRDLFGDP